MPNLVNDFEVRKETLRALGGNPDGLANIFEVDKEILKLISEGGSGIDWDTIKQKLAEDGVESIKFTMGNEDVILNAEEVKNLLKLVISEEKYLTMTVDESNSGETIIRPNVTGSLPNLNLQYRVNGGDWSDFIVGTTADITAQPGDVVQWKGNNPNGLSIDNSNLLNFYISNLCHLSGNVMSLIDGVGDALVIPNDWCFYGLFRDSKVKTVTNDFLPAKTLKKNCYNQFFWYCTELVNAPELPALVTEESCYMNMFTYCGSLLFPPELPSEIISYHCYLGMFESCGSLLTAPELKAQNLEQGCYYNMFAYCTSLKTAPNLPSENISGFCYNGMFKGDTSLTKAPILPAKSIPEDMWAPYQEMFSGCTSLNYVKCLATEIAGYNALTDMLKDVAPTGTLEKPAGVVYQTGVIPEGWTVKEIYEYVEAPMDGNQYARQNGEWTVVESGGSVTPEGKYMTITVYESNSGETVISPTVTGSLPNLNLQYRINNGSWNDFIVGTTADIHVVSGDFVQFKGVNESGISTSEKDYLNFAISGNPVHLSGNVMSLLDGVGDTLVIPYSSNCFYSLFMNSNIKTVSSDFLPATTLASNCYWSMFENCTSLVKAPELPAKLLIYYCYNNMFKGCTSLVTAPSLPATTIENSCYSNMFYGCTSLVKAPEILPATTLKDYCYSSMFEGCTSLLQAPELPSTTLASYCYNSMFYGCTSLTQAPALPATTLAEGCYHQMFIECSNLVQAPELPAPVLVSDCYWRMFYDCTKLKYIKSLAIEGTINEDGTESGSLFGWLDWTSDTGTFEKPDGVVYGTGSIPEGWTVKEIYEYVEAPVDGKQYARKDDAWVEVEPNKVKTTNNTTMQFWSGTQQEYDAIATKDVNTLYVIK